MSFLDKNYTIFAHYMNTGATEELRDWLIVNNAKRVIYVAFPFGKTKQKHVEISIYEKGILKHRFDSLLAFNKPEPIAYIRDFLYAIYWGSKFCKNTDVLVAGDNLLSTAGLLLRVFGITKKVIYYMIDFTPKRYTNSVLNNFYYFLDKTASHNCNYVWPLTKETIEGRFLNNKISRSKTNWFSVPYGNYPLEKLPQNNNSVTNLVYFGGVQTSKGGDLLIDIAESLEKLNFKFKLNVIGYGEIKELKRKIEQKKLDHLFEVHGFIGDFDKIRNLLSSFDIALAPYFPEDKNNFSYYADPGKVKVYLGCALPIVITDVPPIAKTLEQAKAGEISKYEATDFANKIIEINKSINIYKTKAFEMGKEFDWNNIFKNALENIEN